MAGGRDREEEQTGPKRNFSLMDFLNPQNWFGGIGDFFGSIGGFFGGLMGFVVPALVIGTGLYFFGKTETGQKLIGKLFGENGEEKVKDFFDNIDLGIAGLLDQVGVHGMLDSALEKKPIEEIHSLLANQGMNEATIQILAKDKPTFMNHFRFIKANGGSVLNPINDKVLYACLQDKEKAQMCADLLAANTGAATALLPGANGKPAGNDKQKEFLGKIMGAMQSIASDDRIDNLLKPSNPTRPILLSMLERQLGGALRADQLASVIDVTGFKDGKLTETFRNALKGLLSDNAEERNKAVAALIVSPEVNAHRDELNKVFGGLDTSKITDPKMRASVEQAKVGGVGMLQPIARLQLRDIDVQHEMAVFGQGGPSKLVGNALTELLDNDDLRAKLKADNKAGLTDVGLVLEEKLKTATDPQEKASLQFVTTHSRDGKSFQNLSVMFNLVDAIDAKGNDARNKQSLGLMMGLISAKTPQERMAVLEQIRHHSRDFAAFMGDNRQEFGTFLARIREDALPADGKQIIRALRTYWGNDQHAGVGNAFGEEKALNTMLDSVLHPKNIKLPDEALIALLEHAGSPALKSSSRQVVGFMHAMQAPATPAASSSGPTAPARH